MLHYVSDLISVSLKFFFLLTPFFVLSMFLSVTKDYSSEKRRLLAWKVVTAALIACMVILLFGRWIFSVFGITLNAFRIGGGVLLFLSAIQLVGGAAEKVKNKSSEVETDIAVVPLAIPVTVGPATTGALMIFGADANSICSLLIYTGGLLLAHTALFFILRGSNFLQKILKHQGIVILSKLTGLILSALAAEMIFTGAKGFWLQ